MTVQERCNALFSQSEILAPMVRASTTPLRLLALSYGADLVFTEEIIDRSITTCDRVINKNLGTIDYVRKMTDFSPKVQRRITVRNELPVVLRIVPSLESGRLIYQMGTCDPALALSAALMVERDVAGIDINMGCPRSFSVRGGMGSALMSDLPRASDIIKTLRRNITIPISAKIRLLKDTDSTVNFVKGLIKAGANAVTIHAREVSDECIQTAKWDQLVEVVQLVKSSDEGSGVPIIINGDLYTRNDMINMKTKCGADAVMLARPALYNTSIFRKPASDSNDDIDTPTKGCWEETRYGYDSQLLLSKTEVVRDYLRYSNVYYKHPKNTKTVICEMMNNRRAPSKLVPFLPQIYTQTISQVCKCQTMDELCVLWNVSASATEKINKEPKDNLIADSRNYDDRYFVDPESIQKPVKKAKCVKDE